MVGFNAPIATVPIGNAVQKIAAAYPKAFRVFTRRRALVEDLDAQFVNDIQDEVEATQKTIGRNPHLPRHVPATQEPPASFDERMTRSERGLDRYSGSGRIYWQRVPHSNNLRPSTILTIDYNSHITDPNRMIVRERGMKIMRNGWYVVTGSGRWDMDADGYRTMAIGVNREGFAAVQERAVAGNRYTFSNVAWQGWLNEGDEVELYVAQNCGRTLPIALCYLSVNWIRDTPDHSPRARGDRWHINVGLRKGYLEFPDPVALDSRPSIVPVKYTYFQPTGPEPSATPNPSPRTIRHTKQYPCTWSASYKGRDGTHNEFRGSDIVQGYLDDTWGNQKGLIGFDSLQIIDDLGEGVTITGCRIRLNARQWYWNAGGKAAIGAHQQLVRPSTFPSITPSMVNDPGWNEPGTRWLELGAEMGEKFTTGAVRGISLGPGPDDNNRHYGVFNGKGSKNPPLLEITYEKQV